MTSDEPLRSALRQSDGRTFGFAFADGAEMTAVVVSDSHVEDDESLVLLRVDAALDEPAWQVHLDEIVRLTAVNGTILYTRAVDRTRL